MTGQVIHLYDLSFPDELPFVVERLNGDELYEADSMKGALYAAAQAFRDFGCRKVNIRARHSGQVQEYVVLP